MQVRQMSAPLGAIVEDIDIRNVDAADVAELNMLFCQHHVLVFPKQQLTPESTAAWEKPKHDADRTAYSTRPHPLHPHYGYLCLRQSHPKGQTFVLLASLTLANLSALLNHNTAQFALLKKAHTCLCQ